MALTFAPATRKASYARLAMIGASGSGKTFSAITFARGLVGPTGRIALVDTENGSASLYQGLAKTEGQQSGFDVLELGPPWTAPRYIAAIDAAVAAKYDAIIVDQASWLWEGDGGILETVDEIAKGKKTSFEAWKSATPIYWDFIRAILLAQIHVIVCLRAKPAYEIVKDSNGKSKPVKIGTKPIMREGFDFEMTSIFNIDAGHCAEVDKDRTGLYAHRPPTPLKIEDGEKLAVWLDSGAPMEVAAPSLIQPGSKAPARLRPEPVAQVAARVPDPAAATLEQRKSIVDAGKAAKIEQSEILNVCSLVCGFEVNTTADVPADLVPRIVARIIGAGELARRDAIHSAPVAVNPDAEPAPEQPTTV